MRSSILVWQKKRAHNDGSDDGGGDDEDEDEDEGEWELSGEEAEDGAASNGSGGWGDVPGERRIRPDQLRPEMVDGSEWCAPPADAWRN
jgi:hypothetical protein